MLVTSCTDLPAEPPVFTGPLTELPAETRPRPGVPIPGPPAETEAEAPPANDPWGLIVREASERFDVPETWIRAVIKHESGGRAFVNGRPIRGPGGTIGLMQLSPDTFKVMRERYDLGSDPADPYDNVMAGTALIREMYEEFGAPLFLAAYTCGARCASEIRAGTKPLPPSTRRYMESIRPAIASGRPARPDWSVRDRGPARTTPAPSRKLGPAKPQKPTRGTK